MNKNLFKTTARQKEIDKNVAKRQNLKKKWDRHCKYSADEVDGLSNELHMFGNEVELKDFARTDGTDENWVRMLDEGVVVDGSGEVYAVIKKGALKTFYDSIPTTFTGYIDKDHVRAIRLGEYTKDNMRLVKLDDGRYGIDINVKLDYNYYAARDLIHQGEHRAVSVEMFTDVDEFALASKVTGQKPQGFDYLVPLIGAVDIVGYAVCENPKNANSIKDDLLDKASVKGEEMDEDELKKLAAEDAAEAAEGAAEAEEAASGGEAEPAEGETNPDAQPDTSANAEEDKPTDEADSTDTPKEEAPAENQEAESEKSEDLQEDASVKEGLKQLESAIKELREELAAKDKKIAELENQLNAKAEKKLSTSDQIAKLLNFAKGADVSEAEGAEVKSTSDEATNKWAEDDALWDEAAKSLNY